MHFVQYWFNLTDETCEDALLNSTALRRLVGINLGREQDIGRTGQTDRQPDSCR
jgi:hypothetical protein